MLSANNLQLRTTPYNSARELMDDILAIVYPEIFLQLDELHDQIQLLQSSPASIRLLELQRSISDEMTQLFTTEATNLFPFLASLEVKQALSPNCTPFSPVKLHYTAVETRIGEMKSYADLAATSARDRVTAGYIKAAICEFEKKHIFFQLIKDKYLFVPFKKCKGCTSLPACRKETAAMVSQVYSA